MGFMLVKSRHRCKMIAAIPGTSIPWLASDNGSAVAFGLVFVREITNTDNIVSKM